MVGHPGTLTYSCKTRYHRGGGVKKPRLIAIATFLLLVAGALWVAACCEDGNALPYRFATVERGGLQASVSATGTQSVVTTVQVGTQVSGQIEAAPGPHRSDPRPSVGARGRGGAGPEQGGAGAVASNFLGVIEVEEQVGVRREALAAELKQVEMMVEAASAVVNARYNLLLQRTLVDYYVGDLDARVAAGS